VEINTNYALKLFFPTTAFVQVYFEAIANSIDAGAQVIDIHIEFSGSIADSPSVELTIKDDGAGLTDDRFDRFRQLDEPKDAYHKGLGRLVYLKHFAQVEVTSWFDAPVEPSEGNTTRRAKRSFVFSREYKGSQNIEPDTHGTTGTVLRLRDFNGQHVKSYADLKPAELKERIIQQFLPTLHHRKQNEQELTIAIHLESQEEVLAHDFGTSSATVTLADVPDLTRLEFTDGTVDAFKPIVMWYMVEAQAQRQPPTQLTAVNVDGRTIELSLLSARSLPPGTAAVFIFESDLFKTGTERKQLIVDGVSDHALSSSLREQVSKVLTQSLPEVVERNNRMRESCERRFPHLSGLFPEDSVGLMDREEAIRVAQDELFRRERAILESGHELSDELFEQTLEVSARTLMSYILYRQLIIERVQGITKEDQEKVIHDLIVPQRTRYDGDRLINTVYTNNTWLLDDKFMTFRTILSDEEMGKVIAAITLDDPPTGENGRPDISLVFNAPPGGEEAVDVVIVELKRKTSDDKENTYAPVQLLKRARKLVEYCPKIERAWYYAVLQVSEDLEQLLRDDGWKPLYSKGIVLYKEQQLTYEGRVTLVPMFIMSFDALSNDAAARNHAFLELLRSEFSRSRELSELQSAGAIETLIDDEVSTGG